MARYRGRTRPFCVPTSAAKHGSDKEDSGIHLDEPGSPVISPVRKPESPIKSSVSGSVSLVSPIFTSAPRSERSERNVISMRHGVTIAKLQNDDINKSNIQIVPKLQYRRMDDVTTQKGISSVVKQTEGIRLNEPYSLTDRSDTDEIQRFRDKRSRNMPRQSLPVSVTLCVDDDEGLDVGDSQSDLFQAMSQECVNEANSKDNIEKSLLYVDTTESSGEQSSDTENLELALRSETDGKSAVDVKLSKDTKKSRLHSLLPTLKRSQSLGCDTDLMQGDSRTSEQGAEGPQSEVKTQETYDTRRVIHKTCSADAAMMATVGLPIDPQDLVRNKQKSSIARNMRKKFQKLRRRNTDSLLGAAILSVRGTPKITHSNAVEWAASFEALLTDKNGIEMFRNFLKSEFSEENIEFWVACEEFKTVRTNRLVSRAQKIYSDFIAIKAPKQVNLDSKTRLETVTSLENPTREMFREAQKRIQFLMENDSYKRFIDSDSYKNLIRRHSSTDGR